MTTIATDGRIIAADTQQEGNYIDCIKTQKLTRLDDGRLVGFAGSIAAGMKLVRWLEEGGEPPQCKQGATALILHPDGRVFEIETEEWEFIEVGAPAAIGSGSKYAMGAMLAGADPVRAVEIACQLDTGSSLPVRSMSLGGEQ